MTSDISTTTRLQQLLDRASQGDVDARESLLRCACDRLMALTRKLLRDFPQVHRWEQTDDVFQNATLRFCRALENAIPTDVQHFYRLAAMQIRRELIDLSRRYQGPLGLGANHASQHELLEGSHRAAENQLAEGCDATHDPSRLMDWSEFHKQVEQLDDQERQVVDLLWYHGLSQAEAADVMGVSVRSIKRHWQSARLNLHQRLVRIGDE